jgi:acetate kinase
MSASPQRGPDGAELHVLALNAGSASLKFGLFRVTAHAVGPVLTGEAESLGGGSGAFHAADSAGVVVLRESRASLNPGDVLRHIAELLRTRGLPAPQAIGHRIVHGGPWLQAHCRIDAQVLAQLEAAIPFAPVHMPSALAVIHRAQAHFPGAPQAACFDTSFHAQMPELARVLPIPEALRTAGLRRYGFHGLSCESLLRQLGAARPARLIIAHLGNGASVTAVKNGVSIETSMGMTPTGGIVMGTRTGDLDPGVLVYLARERRFDAAMLADLVDRQGGLLAVSGCSADMRELHAAAATNANARLAIDLFCYSAAKAIAAMSVVLDGAQLLLFTGGIGEHDSLVRAAICARLSSIGVRLGDPAAACAVQVLASQEDAEIARQTWQLCSV